MKLQILIKMKKIFKLQDYINIFDIPMDKLKDSITPIELTFLLLIEPDSYLIDIVMDNMMEYFLKEELYEYCAVIRDEKERRLNYN